MRYAGTRRLVTIRVAVILISLLAVTLSLAACSSPCAPTENNIAQIKPAVSSITIGYENGSTIELTPRSDNFDAVCDEALRIALSIDKQCKCVADFQTVEQLSQTNQEFVYVSFTQPVEITTCLFIDDKGREYITTNEDGYRVITSTEIVILPQGTLPEIWAGCETSDTGTKCGMWGSGRSMDKLEAMIDDIGQFN